MIDRTVHQAVKGRAKTVPVTKPSRAKASGGNAGLNPDELATALEMDRSDGLAQDLNDYACRKRSRP